jgi:curved DNA-binding protein CbpA
MDPYAVLGASATDDSATIRSRFRRKSLERHPDRPGGDAAAFREVHDAFEILSDPVKRRRYDEGRHDEGRHFENDQRRPPPEDRDDGAFTIEDVATCGHYSLLLFVYVVAGFSAFVLVASESATHGTMSAVASIHAALGLLALLAWARTVGRSASEPTSDWPTWLRLVVAQCLGSIAGCFAFGALLALSHGLRQTIDLVGGREFQKQDGSTLVCLLTLCVKKQQ